MLIFFSYYYRLKAQSFYSLFPTKNYALSANSNTLKCLFFLFGKGKDLCMFFEVIVSVVVDVNWFDPTSTAKLTGPDYANMAKEVAEMCLHPSRRLPQIYEVIRQATKK